MKEIFSATQAVAWQPNTEAELAEASVLRSFWHFGKLSAHIFQGHATACAADLKGSLRMTIFMHFYSDTK
jgi:hypothetical protein